MSGNTPQSPAEILLSAAVKSVGKREFLKAYEKLFASKHSVEGKSQRTKAEVPAESQCCARIKGDRVGIKVGRYVLFEALQCPRREVSNDLHLCPIHTNQMNKFGELAFGRFAEELSEDQKKVFGEL
jgi:hypothetical protein